MAAKGKTAPVKGERTIAEIEAELERSTVERDEAIAREAATAEVLQIINASPGDLAPVFNAMLERAIRLCDATQGVLWTVDGDRLQIAATYQVPSDFVELLRQVERGERPIDESLRQIMSGERVVHVADVAGQELYRAGHPLVTASVEHGRVRTLIWVALVKDNTPIGAFAIARREVRPFSDKQIALLQNFAAQAVIAMENARLITETREALEQQTATAEVLQVINSSPGDLAPVFEAMLEKAMRLCDAAFGVLEGYDGEGFYPTAMRGVPPDYSEFLMREPLKFPPETAMGRIAAGGSLQHFVDVPEDGPQDSSLIRTLQQLGGIRSAAFAPLRKDGTLLGVFVVYRLEPRPFTDKQIALLQNFAAQAVIAMENARLITETQEALAQQTATAEVLQVINSSPGDLAPVFDTMLAKALDLCEAAFGALITVEGAVGAIVALRNVPSTFVGVLTSELGHLGPETAIGRAVMGRTVIQIADVAATEFYQKGVPLAVAAYDLGGIRSIAFVPLLKDAAVIGVFVVFRQEVRPFTDKQIALLQNFAAQAVIAMENARLITETREALEQQTATAEILQVINSSPGDLAPVFDAMAERAMRLCEADFGGILTYDGERFTQIAARNVPEAFLTSRRAPYRVAPESGLGRVARGEALVHIKDITAEELYRSGDPMRRSFVEITGARTCIWAALRRDGEVLGAITCFRTEVRAFTDKQIALLQNFAAQAVIAMENARLLGELRQRTEEVAELNRGLEARVAEQVDELGRVGRLKRFLAPQLAEMIVSQGDEKILESHRREIVVVFCDLRGYTAFTETAEPEEVLDFLREYHGALGPLVSQFEGTLDQFSGDGIMVFFNDPVPIPDPAERAVTMAAAMREAAGALTVAWRRRGRELGFGAGIAQGYATLGQIGFSERSGYTAIGTVCNVAARLCAEAKDGQILVSQRIAAGLDGNVALEEVGALSLKGLSQPIIAFNVPRGEG
jgi:adenylate cyclase